MTAEYIKLSEKATHTASVNEKQINFEESQTKSCLMYIRTRQHFPKSSVANTEYSVFFLGWRKPNQTNQPKFIQDYKKKIQANWEG